MKIDMKINDCLNTCLRLLLIAGCLSATQLAVARAATYEIRPDGTGDFPTVQDAIDDPAVMDGDVIELASGVFTGEGNRDIDFGGKALVVRSTSGEPGLCIIDCQGELAEPHRGFLFHSGESSGSVVEGLTVRNGFAIGDGGAILVSAGSAPIIQNCTLLDSRAEHYGGGLFIRGGTVEECNFRGNSSGWEGGAVFVGGDVALRRCFIAGNSADLRSSGIHVCPGTVLIENCTIVYNDCPTHAAGIWGDCGSTQVTIRNTIVAFNGGVGIERSGNATVTLECCDIFENAGGNYDGLPDPTGQNGNISENPLFCDPALGDLSIDLSSPCAPGQSGSCGLIGAGDAGCGSTAVESRTWGSIKAQYR